VNPYASLPETAFWKKAVARLNWHDVDPVSPPPFKLNRTDRIATAGSCFAQHISRTLKARGFSYLETETGSVEQNYGVFSARFGNLYTTRQLLQLFQRAYGLLSPQDEAWQHKGRFVDPFRPRVEPEGFATAKDVEDDRLRHLHAVREMFETCDVFIFTLGLTEGWRSRIDGAVFPLAPGVSGIPEKPANYEYHNFTAQEMTADLTRFVQYLRKVNPLVRLIFTVSPVPLVATYEPRHVLVSTIYSKAALRVVAEEVTRATRGAAYFPSFEIITGHHTGYRYFADDLRSVTNEGVDRAMALFSRHYLDEDATVAAAVPEQADANTAPVNPVDDILDRIVCDEEALGQ
jgi:hypothetical protein